MAGIRSWYEEVLAQMPYFSFGQNLRDTLMWKSQGRKPEFLARLAQSRALVAMAVRVQLDPEGGDVPPSVTLGESIGSCSIGTVDPSGWGTEMTRGWVACELMYLQPPLLSHL